MSNENAIVSGNDVGRLSQEMQETLVVVWKIPNFTKKLSEPPSTRYKSPTFAFSDRCWSLAIYPNGDSREETKDYTGLYLLLKGEHGCTITFTLRIRNAKGDAEFSRKSEDKFEGLGDSWGYMKFCANSTLKKRKSELLPNDTLTVECRLKRNDSTPFGDSVTLRDEFEAMYLTGEFCDFDVKVQDRIFRTHKMVLAARSSVLACMLSHDMKEKKTGMVEIVDCDSETFDVFLKFLYCGKYDEIVPKNVVSLYEVANKYNVQNLKAKCHCFMMNNLSTELFCDVMSSALKHDEEELIKHATEYFKLNKKSIFSSVEWQIFMRENTTYASELLMKICD